MPIFRTAGGRRVGPEEGRALTTILLKIAFMQFFGWWRKRLAEAMPFLFPDPDQRVRSGLSVDTVGEDLILPGNLPAGEKVMLRLDPKSVLFNSRSYPFAVIGSVGELLQAEVDELTPFSSSDVVISHRLDRPDWLRRHFSVNFAVIRRRTLGELFQKVRDAGLTPAGATVGSAGQLFFFPFGEAGEKDRDRQLGGMIRGLVALALLFAVAFIPSMKLGQITEERGEQLQAAREEAQKTTPILERVQSVTESLKLLEEHREPSKSALYVLSELSRIFPRDSWLDSFEIESGRLRIVGFSPTPADVVTALSQSAMLTDIQYRAAGVRDQSRDAERFELTAQLAEAGLKP